MSDTTKRIRRAALLVAAGILVSRLLGFLRDVVIASRLGDTPEADAYTAAFILPNFLNYLLAGGFLAITFIPILSKHLANDDREGAAAALGAVFRPLAVVIVALTAIGMVFTEPIVKLLFEDSIGPRFTAEIVTLTRLVLPAQVCFVLGGLYTAVQYAHGRFLIPTLAPIIYNACIILGGIVGSSGPRHWLYGPDGEIIGEGGLLSLVTRPPAQGFIVGAVIGAFLGNFLLQWWGARRTRLRMSGGALSFTDQRFREYLLLAIPLMVGQSIVVLDESLGSFFAAYANSGSIYSLNLARRVNMLPVGVIAQAAGVAAYPFFARLVAEQRFSEMRDTMGQTIRSVVFVSGLAVAIVIAVSQPAIRVAFLHGEFRLEGVRLTSAALVAYALSIPAWGVHQVFARAFYAHRQMWSPVIAGTAWTVAAIPLFLAGFNLFGVQGLAGASSLAVTGYALTLAYLWIRQHTTAGLVGALASTGRVVLAAAIAAGVGWLVTDAIAPRISSIGTGVAAVLAGTFTTTLVYAGVTWIAGSTEIRQLVRR